MWWESYKYVGKEGGIGQSDNAANEDNRKLEVFDRKWEGGLSKNIGILKYMYIRTKGIFSECLNRLIQGSNVRLLLFSFEIEDKQAIQND